MYNGFKLISYNFHNLLFILFVKKELVSLYCIYV